MKKGYEVCVEISGATAMWDAARYRRCSSEFSRTNLFCGQGYL